MVADVLVHTSTQVSLVPKGLFPDICLRDSDQPVRLNVANGKIRCGGSREAELGLELWEHDRLDRPGQAKRLMLQGRFYEADLPDLDIIMGYNFMVSNSAGGLPQCATLIREVNESLSWLLTHYAPGGSQWTGDEEAKIVRAVKAARIKSKGSDAEHIQEYGLAREAYQRMIGALSMEIPLKNVFASKETPKLQICARYWHKGDSVWTNTLEHKNGATCM